MVLSAISVFSRPLIFKEKATPQLSRNDIVFELSFSQKSLRNHYFYDCDNIKYQHFMVLRTNGGFVEDIVVDAYFGLFFDRSAIFMPKYLYLIFIIKIAITLLISKVLQYYLIF